MPEVAENPVNLETSSSDFLNCEDFRKIIDEALQVSSTPPLETDVVVYLQSFLAREARRLYNSSGELARHQQQNGDQLLQTNSKAASDDVGRQASPLLIREADAEIAVSDFLRTSSATIYEDLNLNAYEGNSLETTQDDSTLTDSSKNKKDPFREYASRMKELNRSSLIPSSQAKLNDLLNGNLDQAPKVQNVNFHQTSPVSSFLVEDTNIIRDGVFKGDKFPYEAGPYLPKEVEDGMLVPPCHLQLVKSKQEEQT